eukprot:3096221-Prymnesium_polylepis.1
MLLEPDHGLLDSLCPPDAENTDRLIRSILRVDEAFGDPIAVRPSTSSVQMLAFQCVRRLRFARRLDAAPRLHALPQRGGALEATNLWIERTRDP